jgi:hypothetical protein
MSNLISRDGRGPLSFGERMALSMQKKNVEMSTGTHAEVEKRQAARAVDTSVKAPRLLGAPWKINDQGQ